jgi:hypothetical protein
MQLGLRMENTNGQGTLLGKDLLDRHYTNFFQVYFSVKNWLKIINWGIHSVDVSTDQVMRI